MKLALCLYKYFPYGGLQRDFLRILNECQQRDHEVHVYTSEWQGDKPHGISLNVLPASRIGGNHVRDRRFFNQMQKATAPKRFDAIVGFNKMPGLDVYYGADFCYLGRTAPQYGPLYRLTPRYHHLYTYEKAVFSRDSETQILSLSQREKTVYQQYYGTQEERFHLLPPTLDLDRRPVAHRESVRHKIRDTLGVSPSDALLLFVGSGFKTKGLDRALIALAHLPESLARTTRLVVIGQDQASPYLRLAQKLGVAEQVQFVGGRTDIPELLAAGDLLVHPAYMENTGTILLEAIAAGLPVLATDVCGYAGHIAMADAGKVLPSPFDQDQLDFELASALLTEDRQRWSQNGLTYGAQTSLYQMPKSAADAIETIVEQKDLSRQTPARPSTSPWVFLRKDLESLGQFEDIMSLGGEVYREAPGRRTVRFERNNQRYFLKTHTGVGWQEIIKNLSYLRLPVIGAMNEWHGAHHLQRLGIDTLSIAGYGTASGSPARRQSFIITDEITDAQSLEEFCSPWKSRPLKDSSEIRFKRWLITQLATIARRLHQSGANHRDFYLVHFLLQPGYENEKIIPQSSRLAVIDLHRMQLRGSTPRRWRIKDVAGLHYSSMDLKLTDRDRLRFMKIYSSAPLRDILANEQDFWQGVGRRAQRLYQAEKRRSPQRRPVPAQSMPIAKASVERVRGT